MKVVVILTIAMLLCGCVSVSQYETLQQRVVQLEKSKAAGAMAMAEETGARKFWWRNAITGGGDALDGISASNLTDGDSAFVVKSGTTEILPYIFRSGITEVEDGYLYVNDNTGNGTWFLCTVGTSGVSSYAADGSHFIDVSNTQNLDSGYRQDGRCWYNKTNNLLECYNGSQIQYWVQSGVT